MDSSDVKVYYNDILDTFLKYESVINGKDIKSKRLEYLEFSMDVFGFFLDFCEVVKTDSVIDIDKSVERVPDAEKVIGFINYAYMELYKDVKKEDIENAFDIIGGMTDDELMERTRQYVDSHYKNVE